MNIENITPRFIRLAGIDEAEAKKWQDIIVDAASYIESHSKISEPDEAEGARLEALGAAYAYRLYCMLNGEGFTSFKAGDVSVTSSARSAAEGERVWNEYLRLYPNLIKSEEFIFGRVI